MILLARDLKKLASLVMHVAKRCSNLIGQQPATRIRLAISTPNNQCPDSEVKDSKTLRDRAA